MRRIALSAALVAASLAALLPAAAHAGTQSTTCEVSAKATFDPGLTLGSQNQTVTVKGQLSSCVGGGVTAGVFKARGSGQMSCTGGSGTGRAGIRWDTLETSIATVSISTTGEFTGTITDGKFAGEPITGNLTVQPGPGDCILRPIKTATLSGTVAL